MSTGWPDFVAVPGDPKNNKGIKKSPPCGFRRGVHGAITRHIRKPVTSKNQSCGMTFRLTDFIVDSTQKGFEEDFSPQISQILWFFEAVFQQS